MELYIFYNEHIFLLYVLQLSSIQDIVNSLMKVHYVFWAMKAQHLSNKISL